MTNPECSAVHDDLADLVAGDPAAIDRHSEHLASCDDCRDARHEAATLVKLLPLAGADHVAPKDLTERVLARLGADPLPASAPAPAPAPAEHAQVIPIARGKRKMWIIAGGAAAVAAGVVVTAAVKLSGSSNPMSSPSADVATIQTIDRAAADGGNGLEVKAAAGWRAVHTGEQLPAGAEVRTDERTRAAIALADGTSLVLDHRTQLTLAADEPRHAKLAAGRVVADVAHVDARPAWIDTPSGRVEVVGTKFALTASDQLTVVQVVRGAVVLRAQGGTSDEVRAGEEGVIDHGKLAVDAAPGLAHEVEWSELAAPKKDEASAGLGALRAYKPGESRDRDWNLALASHDVKVRVSGPVARTEITEVFRNDADATLEGVYQFPLPPDARIDALALDVDGQMVDGAFVDKERAQKIWRGVIDKATPKKQEIASDIIWVDGRWSDPALLDWKRGGRFELRIYPIPAKGKRTIKLAYTQVVTPRGPWRQYVYPLPHSNDGSTVADTMTVDVEVRGAQPGQVRAAGYDMQQDPARSDVNALTLKQTGFVPRGDLVVDYRATEGDAELRAWTFAGATAAAPDDKLAAKKNVGIDDKVIDAQRAVAADSRPTAVLALRPKLPRWREAKTHDYMIVVDTSQSMVGERATRASELATRLIEQIDRRDQFSVMACDSACRSLGQLRSPSVAAAKDAAAWLAAEPAAGASDLVASVRAAAAELPASQDHERWVIYIGDGFASTGFRSSGDVERAIAQSTTGIHVTTIGIGTDADSALLGAVARGGGGSYLAWVPGQSVKTAAVASLESTYGNALRGATIQLPTGLADVAPSVLPTVRAGEEVLVAARVTGDVAGDVIVKGTVGGQPFEQHYPLKLAVSSAPGNGFVPRLWASLAIEQLERKSGDERPQIVALSQGYGVMSRETSLLVLESAAMFDAFGVDRTKPAAATWTGEEALDEVTTTGTIAMREAQTKDAKKAERAPAAAPKPQMAPPADAGGADFETSLDGGGGGAATRRGNLGRGAISAPAGFYAMRRTWVRIPSVNRYDTVAASITKAVGNAERELTRSPDSREKHRALVQSLAYAGELDRAMEVAQKWLARDQLDPAALTYIADLLGRQGKRDLALRTLAGTVDLDADRAATHERMVTAYENSGRIAQACSHRIALAAIAPKADAAKQAGAALRCLRGLGRNADAELVLRGLADDATRTAAESAAAVPPPAPKLAGDLMIDARWDGGDDLDLTLLTPEGARISWMGGKADVTVADATSTTREQLALKSLKKGNYLVEVGRSAAASGAGRTARGTLDISVLGTKKSLPFELTGTRAVIGRITISLEEKLEQIGQGRVGFGTIANPLVKRVVLSRQNTIRQCYQNELASNPDARGRIMLSISIEPGGQTTSRLESQSGNLGSVAQCATQALAYMHVEGSAPGILRLPLTFTP
jgi:ferric-dicitrate binding protein FerR (iron transport regulator)/tetratricopeptide (TPR) repeat protein